MSTDDWLVVYASEIVRPSYLIDFSPLPDSQYKPPQIGGFTPKKSRGVWRKGVSKRRIVILYDRKETK